MLIRFALNMKAVQPGASEAQVIRVGDREAVKFVTASGVTAIVATSISPELLRALKLKLQRKLRRHALGESNGG